MKTTARVYAWRKAPTTLAATVSFSNAGAAVNRRQAHAKSLLLLLQLAPRPSSYPLHPGSLLCFVLEVV